MPPTTGAASRSPDRQADDRCRSARITHTDEWSVIAGRHRRWHPDSECRYPGTPSPARREFGEWRTVSGPVPMGA
ncbi:hypothetical protein GCM10010294_05720 [Streptomyces griseoloalbus]|nr:hypothetical protein GCM10010294_05720 [Streptomyces griseoloalbus]